jgi:hypothetical protein
VHATERQLRIPERSQIGVRAESDGAFLVVDGQKLLEIENLNAVAGLFTTDNDIVLVSPNFSPAARRYTGSLRKTTQVPELSSGGDL